VSKRLTLRENVWLKGLRKDLERGEAESILKEGRKRGKELPADAYLDAIFHGNAKTFREVIEMGKRGLTFEDVLMETGILPKWIEKGREEGLEKGREEGIEKGLEKGKEIVARNLLNMGMSVKKTAEAVELDVKKVRALTPRS
jgi:predicted transposase YdaD